MRTLHELPQFHDRWSYQYFHYGELGLTNSSLVFRNANSTTDIPITQLSLIMLGPGTTITHAAVKTLAASNCLIAWVAEDGVRLYAHSTGGTFSARRLIHQAKHASDDTLRLHVARRMFTKRFPDVDLTQTTLEQLRGMEGIRVRAMYSSLAEEYGVSWGGRNYDQSDWDAANPNNRALSAANACLYGVCHAAIVSAGYSAGLGFIHTGKLLSFVYDIADLYKSELTVPLAFELAKRDRNQLEKKVRVACRERFAKAKLMDRIIPDIAEVLNAGHDLGTIPGELEGRAVSLADSSPAGDLHRPPEQTHPGGTLDESVPENPTSWHRDSDLEHPQ
jgi:CRISP-associated protein Cas1